ncbi:hypothetical protein jhhlp_003907 [Lomentospora prolificans]|uniref:Ubiquitin 3 binding protein But2 C-terminal domain-containing protein n=1 Tax=Lomentospora prolificans TaxID=41688 RepID=A0A2N3NA28_9PEZI|nr:hypothetical protein jhhlp_003907 [Lomentospora prolificans]
MSLLKTVILSLCAAATTSALKITSFTHSGPACPQDSDVTWNGNSDAPVFYLEDYSAKVSPGEISNCALHLTIGSGKPNQALVLGEVSVWGGLGLAANGAATFFTSAFWAETAGDGYHVIPLDLPKTTANLKSRPPPNQVTKRLESSTSRAFTGNVAVDADLDLASPCTSRDGYVGILTVNFRVLAEEGTVTFGPEKTGSKTKPVSEHLQFSWTSC